MNATGWRIAIGLAGSLVGVWLILVVVLLVARPKAISVTEILRLLPDTLRLVRRLAMDSSLPRGVRWRLILLVTYLAIPFDLVPDFLPVIGQLDDVIIVMLTLRSVVRIAGGEAVKRHWPGNDVGLAALWKLGGFSGEPPATPDDHGAKAANHGS